MKKVIGFLVGIIILLIAYLLFFPISIEPASWEPSKAPEFVGRYQKNSLLENTQKLFDGLCLHCEDVALDSLGRIYGGDENGQILRFDPITKKTEIIANTEGRPLGLDFDLSGNLIIADAFKGILSLTPTGSLQVLETSHNGIPFGFADDLEVAPDGKIYFSDASHKLGIGDFKMELIEHKPNGRLLVFDPVLKKTELLLDSLYFANGIAVSADNDFVLVNETGTYAVTKYWLKGDKKGNREVFIDNLPGFPDGISRGNGDIFWLTLISPRNSLLDKLGPKPFWRKVIARLPEFMKPQAVDYGFILGLDKSGEVIYNFQDPSGGYGQCSSVQQFGNKLYFGSLKETSIGVFDLP
jgi:sugar lactone lactonase YvrE